MQQHLIDWQKKLNRSKTRGIVFINDNDELIAEIKRIIEQLKFVLIDTRQFDEKNILKHHQSLLGTDADALMFDATKNFDCNLFAAISGTIKGGGIVFTILSSNIFNAVGNDFEAQSNGLPETLKRLITRSTSSQSWAKITSVEDYFFSSAINTTDSIESALDDENILVDKIIRVATGHAKRPLVITAKRGRGKSSALGIAAKNLVNNYTKRIIVTAPRKSNLINFYQQGFKEASVVNDMNFDNSSQILFLPIDEIYLTLPPADLLIVDEAAAIPVQVLDKITSHYNRFVFATTTDGYEGNGRGFEVRFKQKLIAKLPQTKFATLKLPIRWSKQDELETIIEQAFLLNYQLEDVKPIDDFDSLTFEILDKNSLRKNESLLSQIFSLLANAHYQTRPSDLESTFANEKIKVVCLKQNTILCAVALINFEGGFSERDIKTLDTGKRVSKGDLLPQSLMINYAKASLAQAHFVRVMRIAVHPSLQAQGLGSYLLKLLKAEIKSSAVDFIGASFAVEPTVIDFWIKNNYIPIRFGSTKDSSSGSHTCEVIQPVAGNDIDENLEQEFHRLNKEFMHSFLFKLKGEWKSLDNAVIFSCLKTIVKNKERFDFNTHNLNRFSQAQKSLRVVDWQLENFYLFWLRNNHHAIFSHERDDLIISLILKSHTIAEVVSELSLSGKKQLIDQLRSQVHKMISSATN